MADRHGDRQPQVAAKHLAIRHVQDIRCTAEEIDLEAGIKDYAVERHGAGDVGLVVGERLGHIGACRRGDTNVEGTPAKAVGAKGSFSSMCVRCGGYKYARSHRRSPKSSFPVHCYPLLLDGVLVVEGHCSSTLIRRVFGPYACRGCSLAQRRSVNHVAWTSRSRYS